MARKDQIQKMKDILITRRDALRQALAGDMSMLQQLREQTGGDVVDAALDSAQDELSSHLVEVESRELAHIEHALGRIREGAYGECEICSAKIPMARLNALPYATMCIECQQASENGTLDDRRPADWGRVIDTGFGDADVSIRDLELQ